MVRKFVQKWTFIFFGQPNKSRSEIAVSYGNFTFIFWRIAKLFSIMTTPFYIPTSSTQVLQLVYIFADQSFLHFFFIVETLMGLK